MRRTILVVALVALAAPIFGSVSVKRSLEKPSTLDVNISGEPLSVAIAALELYLPAGVEIDPDIDKDVTLHARQLTPLDALRAIATDAGLVVDERDDVLVLREPNQPTVTLDVKDAEARVILKSMQRQCGIKNLIVDPNVQGSGTFLFRDVPCRTAFVTVLRSMGLASVVYSRDVTLVEPRRQ